MPLVADTGPLNYLIQIGRTDIIPQIFGTVYVPKSVLEELCHSAAPDVVKQFGKQPPDWVQVVSLGETSIPSHSRLSRTDSSEIFDPLWRVE